MTKKFAVYGSCGRLVADAETGEVLAYDPSDGGSDTYENIQRFDVIEYAEYNGCVRDTDILLIGYWTKDGDYEPPEYEFRDLQGEEITDRYKQSEGEE